MAQVVDFQPEQDCVSDCGSRRSNSMSDSDSRRSKSIASSVASSLYSVPHFETAVSQQSLRLRRRMMNVNDRVNKIVEVLRELHKGLIVAVNAQGSDIKKAFDTVTASIDSAHVFLESAKSMVWSPELCLAVNGMHGSYSNIDSMASLNTKLLSEFEFNKQRNDTIHSEMKKLATKTTLPADFDLEALETTERVGRKRFIAEVLQQAMEQLKKHRTRVEKRKRRKRGSAAGSERSLSPRSPSPTSMKKPFTREAIAISETAPIEKDGVETTKTVEAKAEKGQAKKMDVAETRAEAGNKANGKIAGEFNYGVCFETKLPQQVSVDGKIPGWTSEQRRIIYTCLIRPDLYNYVNPVMCIVAEEAVQFNESHFIVGHLEWTEDGCISQMIEGPEYAISALWRRIQRDNRIFLLNVVMSAYFTSDYSTNAMMAKAPDGTDKPRAKYTVSKLNPLPSGQVSEAKSIVARVHERYVRLRQDRAKFLATAKSSAETHAALTVPGGGSLVPAQ